jgi:gluconate 5-dehydrogenase
MGTDYQHGWEVENWKYQPSEIFDLTSKVAIVTGGGSGLGRAIALGLDAFGSNVVVTDINLTGAEEVANRLENEAIALKVDVTQAFSIKKMVQTVMDKFGRVDISFNIPGINIRKPAIELEEAEWRRILDINLTGLFLCAREVGKVMLAKGKGSIINMASARGLVGGSSQSAYSISKAGVIQLT